MLKTCFRTIVAAAACIFLPDPALSQDVSGQSEGQLRMFLDCPQTFCDLDFYRREISFVDYVRDRQDADVHVLVRTESSGGGFTYSLSFIGLGQFESTQATLQYFASATNTFDETRRGLARTIKFGLMQFVAELPVADRIEISYRPQPTGASTTASQADDPWNFWVFQIRGNGSLNGESASKRYSIGGNVRADRITNDWKINFRVNGNYNRSDFELNDSTTFVNTSKSYGATALIVRSISTHWSVGVRSSATSSTFLNTDVRFQAGPAIEFDIFPYSESSRRLLTFQYSAGINSVDYEQITIFDKTQETLLQHSLAATLAFTQPWGTASVSLRGSQFMNDLGKNNVTLFSAGNVRLFRGLSFNLFGSVSRVRDQLHLARGGATDEEILLRRRQLGTSYRYQIFGGFTYRFGSIFNNIVNPRFGGGGGVFFFN